MRSEIRIEARVRNNVLWHAIFDTNDSVADFCRKHNFYQGIVGELLNLKISPLNKKCEFRDICKRLSDAFGISCEELFPLHLYSLERTQAVI